MSEFETLFSYTHLRNHYLNSDLSSGRLAVQRFVRAEHCAACRDSLLQDSAVLSTRPNTWLQQQLSPVSRQILWELHSGIMLRVLENITGLHNLLPDVHCRHSAIIQCRADLTDFRWHDDETNLEAALTVTISLNTGDAVLCTTPAAVSNITVDGPALHLTYWQHDNQSTVEQPA